MGLTKEEVVVEQALTSLYSLATVGAGKFFKTDLTALEKASGKKFPMSDICLLAKMGAKTPGEVEFVEACRSALVEEKPVQTPQPLPAEVTKQLDQEVREQIGSPQELEGSDSINNTSIQWKDPIELYYAGDSIGAIAEGGAGGTVSYERALTGLKVYPTGTDESDTARLFLQYCAEVGIEGFSVTDWYAYHTKNRAATTYGKTWGDHFNTVEFILKKKGTLDYDQLVSLSKDRGSNGNGCLALAYPIAKLFGDRALQITDRVTAGTHCMARQTMQLAVQYFQGKKTHDEVIRGSFPTERTDGWELTPLSHGCLWAAATIAKEPTVKDVIKKALDMGADVDSYLSLGMLMWGVKRNSNSRKPLHAGILPDDLMEMIGSSRKPDGEELIRLLQRWFEYAPNDVSGFFNWRDVFDFLKWLIGGRVVQTIKLLEASDMVGSQQITQRLRKYGDAKLGNGPGVAKQMQLNSYGWIGVEIGNPTWRNQKDVLIVELPTVQLLEQYIKLIGGEYGANEYFKYGFYRKENVTSQEFDFAKVIASEYWGFTRCLVNGGLWVYSIEEPSSVGMTREELAHIDEIIFQEARDQVGFPPDTKEVTITAEYIPNKPLSNNLYTVEIEASTLYDIGADPDGLKTKSMYKGRFDFTLYEKNISEAGYAGYWRDHNRLGKIVVSFEPVQVEAALVIPSYYSFLDYGVGLLDVVATLASSEYACNQLEEYIGGERGKSAVAMMHHGLLSGGLGGEIYDFFMDEIKNEAKYVWEGVLYNPNDEDNPDSNYPVMIRDYEGVFFVSALEFDDAGYFLSFEEAEDYVFTNFVYVKDSPD